MSDMFCDKCGAANKESAGFCRKCGASFHEGATAQVDSAETEVETRVAQRAGVDRRDVSFSGPAARAEPLPGGEEIEAELFSINPTLKFVKAGYVGAAIGAVLLVALASAFFASYLSISGAVAAGLLILLVPAYHHLKQKIVRYTLTESKLEIDTGLISRTTRNVPLRRIQDVTVSSNMWQRLLGFGDLVIDNASEEGGKVVLKNIDTPRRYADELLRQMRKIEG